MKSRLWFCVYVTNRDSKAFCGLLRHWSMFSVQTTTMKQRRRMMAYDTWRLSATDQAYWRNRRASSADNWTCAIKWSTLLAPSLSSATVDPPSIPGILRRQKLQMLGVMLENDFTVTEHIQGGPRQVKPTTILLVTFECVGKIQWFLGGKNCIQEVVRCKFCHNKHLTRYRWRHIRSTRHWNHWAKGGKRPQNSPLPLEARRPHLIHECLV